MKVRKRTDETRNIVFEEDSLDQLVVRLAQLQRIQNLKLVLTGNPSSEAKSEALSWGIELGNTELIKILLDSGAVFCEEMSSGINDKNTLNCLLELGIDVNFNQVLISAILGRDSELESIALKKGASLKLANWLRSQSLNTGKERAIVMRKLRKRGLLD